MTTLDPERQKLAKEYARIRRRCARSDPAVRRLPAAPDRSAGWVGRKNNGPMPRGAQSDTFRTARGRLSISRRHRRRRPCAAGSMRRERHPCTSMNKLCCRWRGNGLQRLYARQSRNEPSVRRLRGRRRGFGWADLLYDSANGSPANLRQRSHNTPGEPRCRAPGQCVKNSRPSRRPRSKTPRASSPPSLWPRYPGPWTGRVRSSG